MRIHIDDSELKAFYIDLRGAPLRVQTGAKRTTRQGAKLINKAMRSDASGHRYLGGLPKAVSDEMIGPFEAEIGLSPGGQGSLAHIIAYGSVNNAPVYDYTAGPRRTQPVLEEMYTAMAEDSVLGGNK